MVAVVAPMGNSDHSSLSAVISMAHAVPNLRVSRKVFLKHQVNWNTVCGAIQELPWRNIWLSDNPVEVLYKPGSSEYVTRISLGLMINVGMLLASSKSLIVGGPVIALELIGKNLSAIK